MRKLVIGLMVALTMVVAVTAPASAQDAVIGTVEADPAIVPEAGEYTFTATGSDFIPDSDLLLLPCVAPGEVLVAGEAGLEDILAAAGRIDPLQHCDLAGAVPISTDGDGGWTGELTAEVGDNFFLSAGAIDGSQAGATWVPIGDLGGGTGGGDALADTGVESAALGIIGVAMLAGGAMVAREARRHR